MGAMILALGVDVVAAEYGHADAQFADAERRHRPMVREPAAEP
jgi:hypothetical protein